MKIKKLKYIMCFAFCALFFLNSLVLSDLCSEHPDSGHGTTPPGNDASSGYCWSFETNQSSPSWYNNNIALNVEPSFSHWLYDIGSFWHLENGCSYYEVSRIQTLMQQIGGDCSTCIDGKAGHHMRTHINNCMSELCRLPETATDGGGGCGQGTTLTESRTIGGFSYQCCKPVVDVEFSSIDIVETQWEHGYLHVDISSTIEDAEDYGFDVDSSKITATNANGENLSNISLAGAEIVTSNMVKQSVTIQASTGSAVTVNVNAGFFKASDDDNIVAESPAGSETFTPEEDPIPECSYPPGGVYGDDCETRGGTWYFDSETNCCVEGDSCVTPPDSNGNCPSNNLVINDEGCCVDYVSVTCDSPLISPMVIDNNPPSCSYGYSLQNGCCACDLFAGDDGCGDGYSPNSQGCCRPASQMCGENQYMPSGSTGCVPCEEGTIPDDSHTKCVCNPDEKCCGIQLNTVVPFIGDCIEMTASSRGDTTSVTSVTAFPVLMQGLMKILMSAIMVFSFLMVIIAGFMMTTAGFGGSGGFTKGKTILKNVIISLILLGCSGLILSLVNPNFFGG